MIRSFALPVLLAAAWLPLAGVELRYPLRLEEIRRLPVEQRRQAYIAIAQDNRKLADYGEAIPYLLAGIRDGDQLIRRTATMQGAGLLTILQANRQIGRPLSLDVASIGEVQDALIGVAFDPDPQTRGAAREALIYSDAPSEWIERLAIACYKHEPMGELRGGILLALAYAGYDSEAVVQLMLQGLDDPDLRARSRAASAVAQVTPDAALPKLLQLLNEDKEMAPDPVIQAIGAYGPRARPHLPILQAVSDSGRLGGTAVERMRKAIQQVQSDEPPVKPPRVRAVSLRDPALPPPAAPATPPVEPPPAPTPPAPDPPPPTPATPSNRWPIIAGLAALAAIIGVLLTWLRR